MAALNHLGAAGLTLPHDTPRRTVESLSQMRFTQSRGEIFINGLHALVRLPMMQRLRDAAAGLNSAGFISGYRGSPLGGYDQLVISSQKLLAEHHVRFEPGLNEELAATSIWGTQQTGFIGGFRYDGIFGLWYGKCVGVDRCGDVFKFANWVGTSATGGVLCIAGDDHAAQSSAVAGQSEQAFMAAMMPILNPADVQDYLEYGLFGWALSRYSGCWIGFKAEGSTVESSMSVNLDAISPGWIVPDDFDKPVGGLNIRWPDGPLQQESRLIDYKMSAARAFARANRIDRVAFGADRPRIGILSTGKAYRDTREALTMLGLNQRTAEQLGLGIYKVGMVWPLDTRTVERFADGVDEILVIEEKRSVIEAQIKDHLFNLPSDRRPRVIGKTDELSAPLVPSSGLLAPDMLARIIVRRLSKLYPEERFESLLARLPPIQTTAPVQNLLLSRPAYFCSGCPHNMSTNVPQGSRAIGGTGCHALAMGMDRSTVGVCQMGGEGVFWVGQAPFSNEKHVFANLGDGTYQHSGILAIRAAIAARVNMTYKILFNDAVAMTGGQTVEGEVTPWKISRQLYAEGVRHIAVVTDEPAKYSASPAFAPEVRIHHRKELEEIQRRFRTSEGVSAIIYDQTCAAEKRRRRKRGVLSDPAIRAVINPAVCEGCGDCGVKSNCISIEPLRTEFGQKRQINQSSCNKDFSCIEGFCPSFVTVKGATMRKGTSKVAPSDEIPLPTPAPIDESYNIVISGIGGTGIVTIAALLGMAAHVDGLKCSVLDMTGMAQKNGAVLSYVRIGSAGSAEWPPQVPAGFADLLLGCDLIVAAGHDAMAAVGKGRTYALLNSHVAPTGAFSANPDLQFSADAYLERICGAAGPSSCESIDASKLAVQLMGDAISTNMFLLGVAFQRGRLPIRLAAIERAIELNATSVSANKRCFAWGRLWAVDPDRVKSMADVSDMPEGDIETDPIDQIIGRRSEFLIGYQNRAYAARYLDLVGFARGQERQVGSGNDTFTRAVAVNYFKLLAYKDEYEVARLQSSREFLNSLRTLFEGRLSITYHLAPPLLSRPRAGRAPRKYAFGAWVLLVFRALAWMRSLRGTAFDPFGYTAERRLERSLIRDYAILIRDIGARLEEGDHALAVQLASFPAHISGYGHIKAASIKKALHRRDELFAQYGRSSGGAKTAGVKNPQDH
jgi:indolepyruvate ferredoxin oxidoreductase